METIEIKKQLPVITMNFDEVKTSLEEQMKKYEGIVVTEEGLKDCKATQKDLAGLRNKIDTYRKTVKKEMEVPIKKFEVQCKGLISLIADVEKPIKEGILIYDNKRKEEKKEKVSELIKQSSQNLHEKYSEQLTVKDEYLNLSKSFKSIKEDIEYRAKILENQQLEEKQRKEIFEISIKNTIDSVNENIKTKLEFKDFTKYIEYGWDLNKILKEINERAEMIALAEKPKEEIKVIKEDLQVPKQQEVQAIKQEVKQANKYFVEIYVSHNFEKIQALSKFLKENDYEYKVKNKGKVED